MSELIDMPDCKHCIYVIKRGVHFLLSYTYYEILPMNYIACPPNSRATTSVVCLRPQHMSYNRASDVSRGTATGSLLPITEIPNELIFHITRQKTRYMNFQ